MFKQFSNYIFNLKYKNNMFALYNKTIEKSEKKNHDKGNILIAPVSGAPVQSLFDGLYARKALLNGNSVYTLFCNQFVDLCEILNYGTKLKNLRCNFCKNFQQLFINVFETIPCYYNDILNRKDIVKINYYIEQYMNRIKEKNFFLGININEILYSTLQRHYMVADPEIKNDKTTKLFLFTIFSTILCIDKLCKKIKPKYVMITHGTYSLWGPILEYCKVNNIRIITYGRSYNKYGLNFAFDETYLKKHQNDKLNNWKNRELTLEQKKLVEKAINIRIGKSKGEIAFNYNAENKKFFSKDEICHMLKINKSRKIVALLPNIPWDGQFNGNSLVYPLFRDWLKDTVEFFKNRDDSVLLIRSHPAEVLKRYNVGDETTQSMINEIFDILPDNVMVLPHDFILNSYALGLVSDFILVYSSTVGLELTYLKKPVLAVGNPPYINKGIVYD
ncbi:MAG: hypothetical protein LBF97_02365, partial [Elusimicrobiota bacterium]|nr:hypothetical protein [Elusimicrobiota bacterium]